MTDDLTTTATQQELHEAAEKFKQWTILGAGEHLVPGTRYQLKGTVIRKFLQYERQGTFGGINLGWTDDASAETAKKVTHWTFARAGSDRRPIRYDEKIAVAWKDDYIYYGKRNVGINLKWSETPKYEWQLLGAPQDSAVGPRSRPGRPSSTC